MPGSQALGNQQKAVESSAAHLVVIAPPGCGKTEVLAMRADHLIRNGTVRPQRRLLALTFTNRAKENLSGRLRAQLGEQRFRSSVAVMNFHELGARIVESHWRSISLNEGFTFPQASWMRKAMGKIDNNWKNQKVAGETLDGIKRNPIDDQEVLRLVESSGNYLALKVEERRQAENYLDYGDVLRHAHCILQNERIAGLFQQHFDAVLVDEFQDLSLQQFEIASRICVNNSIYVGDPLQGIFGWAGADPVAVSARLALSAQETVELDVSFRSSPAVLKVVNSVSAGLGAAALHAADPTQWAGGGFAYAAEYASDEEEAKSVVTLTDYLATNHPNDRIGVIVRAAYRRGPLERAYLGAAHKPQYWDIALETPRIVRLLKQHARRISVDLPFAEQVEELMRRVTTGLRASDVDTLKEVASAAEQLLELEQPGESLTGLMGRIRDTQDPSPIPAGVHVLNAHVGKGQQFDWVVVIGLEEGHVPSAYSTTAAELLEEQRVLLVMLSRARKGLFITHAKKTTNKYGRVFKEPASRWWNAMKSACMPLDDHARERLSLTGV